MLKKIGIVSEKNSGWLWVFKKIVSQTWGMFKWRGKGFRQGAVLCLVAQSCLTVCNPIDYSRPGSSVHGDSPGKNTGVGCHALLQGIFPTQRSNPGLLYWRRILYPMKHQGSPRMLGWVAHPVSRVSSWPGNQTGVSCVAGEFFTSWATRETKEYFIN